MGEGIHGGSWSGISWGNWQHPKRRFLLAINVTWIFVKEVPWVLVIRGLMHVRRSPVISSCSAKISGKMKLQMMK